MLTLCNPSLEPPEASIIFLATTDALFIFFSRGKDCKSIYTHTETISSEAGSQDVGWDEGVHLKRQRGRML